MLIDYYFALLLTEQEEETVTRLNMIIRKGRMWIALLAVIMLAIVIWYFFASDDLPAPYRMLVHATAVLCGFGIGILIARNASSKWKRNAILNKVQKSVPAAYSIKAEKDSRDRVGQRLLRDFARSVNKDVMMVEMRHEEARNPRVAFFKLFGQHMVLLETILHYPGSDPEIVRWDSNEDLISNGPDVRMIESALLEMRGHLIERRLVAAA